MLPLLLALACADPPPATPPAAPAGPSAATPVAPSATAPVAPSAATPVAPSATHPPVPVNAVPTGDAMPSTWEVRGPGGGSLLQLWPRGPGVEVRLVGGVHDHAGDPAGAPAACALEVVGPLGAGTLVAGADPTPRVEVAFPARDSATVTAKPGSACADGVSFDGPYTRLPAARDPLALCRPGEAPWFACLTDTGNHAALCGTTDPETAGSTLQYRFGHPGDVRLAWPAGGASPETSFERAHETHVRSTSTTVHFDNDGYTFRIWSQTGGGDDNGMGVTVEQGGKVVGKHTCVGVGGVDRLDGLKGLLPEG